MPIPFLNNTSFSAEITVADDINASTKIVIGEGASPELRLKKTEPGSAKVSFYSANVQKSYLDLDASEDMVYYAAGGVRNVFFAGNVLNEIKTGANSVFSGNVTTNGSIRVSGGTDPGSQLALFADSNGHTSLAGFDFEINTGGNNSRSRSFFINSSGAIKFDNYNNANNTGTPTYILGTNSSGNVVKVLGADIPGVPGGSGSVNTVPLWTPDGDTLGDSAITFNSGTSTTAVAGLFYCKRRCR